MTQYVAVTADAAALLNGSPTVTVRGVAEDRATARLVADASDAVLEVHYMSGRRAPRKGDRLSTWRDGSTLYAVAPRP